MLNTFKESTEMYESFLQCIVIEIESVKYTNIKYTKGTGSEMN